MRLNRSSRDELRESLKVMLQSVPDGERICIPKDILEALLSFIQSIYCL